jgi:hypothetical protein
MRCAMVTNFVQMAKMKQGVVSGVVPRQLLVEIKNVVFVITRRQSIL